MRSRQTRVATSLITTYENGVAYVFGYKLNSPERNALIAALQLPDPKPTSVRVSCECQKDCPAYMMFYTDSDYGISVNMSIANTTCFLDPAKIIAAIKELTEE